jgi:hypothetical protein
MKSITIHNLDDRAAKKLESLSQSQGSSLNKTIKKLLNKALGLDPNGGDHRREFEEFSGIWSTEEAETFAENTAQLRQINAGDWQ